MTPEEKKAILKGVERALDTIDHGSITLELRGVDRPVDLVVENRTRFTTSKGVIHPHKKK